MPGLFATRPLPGWWAEGCTMSYALYVDPIAHAWRHCNPHAPLPLALVPRGAPSGLALSLYSSHGQHVTESEPAEDIRYGLLTVATLPRISPSNEPNGGTDETAALL